MALVGHPQRRSVPRRDQSAERCESREICRNHRKNVLVLEKQWSHGCCHISFPKSCYDGKHAKVSGVSRWVEVKDDQSESPGRTTESGVGKQSQAGLCL